jgi:hypothetical protein
MNDIEISGKSNNHHKIEQVPEATKNNTNPEHLLHFQKGNAHEYHRSY